MQKKNSNKILVSLSQTIAKYVLVTIVDFNYNHTRRLTLHKIFNFWVSYKRNSVKIC